MSIGQHPPRRLVWHHLAHQRWAGQELYFWFLTFKYSYNPAEALPALDEVAEQFGLSSFASYELLGGFDIMARLYVPKGKTEELRAAIDKHPRLPGLNGSAEFFRVTEVVRHWPWGPKGQRGGPTHDPDEEVLAHRRPDREIAVINEIGRSGDPRRAVAGRPLRGQLLKQFKDAGLVTEFVPKPGIKLVIRIALATADRPSKDELDAAKGMLSRALDRAGRLLTERSLYAAEDRQSVLFLIMCRVKFENFHRIRSKFVQEVREAAGIAGARTMTLVTVSADFHCYRDAMPAWIAEPHQPHLLELLEHPEDDEFEAKGSAYAHLADWLTKDQPLTESKDALPEAILKTIVGFLNSGGGLLAIGVLEIDRSRVKDGERKGELFPKIADCPKIGPHVCIGLVDPSFKRGWDHYVRKLRGHIASNITPPPGVLIDIHPESVDGADICVVRVFDPGDKTSYYLKKSGHRVFYARQGAETKPLDPSEIDLHREQVAIRRLARNAHNA